MKYLMIICGNTEYSSDGHAAPENLAVMHVRNSPGGSRRSMAAASGCSAGSLISPETGASVRVRDGETLVTDGPFAETKEFIAGFNLLECSNRDEAIEVAAKCPCRGSIPSRSGRSPTGCGWVSRRPRSAAARTALPPRTCWSCGRRNRAGR